MTNRKITETINADSIEEAIEKLQELQKELKEPKNSISPLMETMAKWDLTVKGFGIEIRITWGSDDPVPEPDTTEPEPGQR